MDPREFAKMLGEIEARRDSDSGPSDPEKLKMAYENFSNQYQFKPGDLVMWKNGYGIKERYPRKGEAAIVVEMLDPPFRSIGSKIHGEPHYGELNDMRIGVFVDGDVGKKFLIYTQDSRLYQPYQSPEELSRNRVLKDVRRKGFKVLDNEDE